MLTHDKESSKFYISGKEALAVGGHFCSKCQERTTIVMGEKRKYRIGCICSALNGIALEDIDEYAEVEMCNQYRPQYPNKRDGLCDYSNTYGDHGCDLERTEFCQTGPEAKACECRRCSNSGCDNTCPLFTDWSFGSCKHQNSYGDHGCPECLD